MKESSCFFKTTLVKNQKKKKAKNKYSQHKIQNRRNQGQVVYHKKLGTGWNFI